MFLIIYTYCDTSSTDISEICMFWINEAKILFIRFIIIYVTITQNSYMKLAHLKSALELRLKFTYILCKFTYWRILNEEQVTICKQKTLFTILVCVYYICPTVYIVLCSPDFNITQSQRVLDLAVVWMSFKMQYAEALDRRTVMTVIRENLFKI
jgi:hypothetical protein